MPSLLTKQQHYLLWVLHNCLAHFILAFFPNHYAFEFHELTNKWMNGEVASALVPTYQKEKGLYGVRYVYRQAFDYKPVMIKGKYRKFWWVFHNAVVHMMVGLLPFKPLMKIYNWSAKKVGETV